MRRVLLLFFILLPMVVFGQIRMGVTLPISNSDAEGRRMLEYYRGMLIACDSLRSRGVSIEVFANDSIKGVETDVVFGNRCVQKNFQSYMLPPDPLLFNEQAVAAFLERYPDANVVIIGCNNPQSDKGLFTNALREALDARGRGYHITNLNTPEDQFKKAFVEGKRNVVVLNSARQQDLNMAFMKLNELTFGGADYRLSLYGHPEWLAIESSFRSLLNKYDTYIPATSYYYRGLTRIATFEQNYRAWFGTGLQDFYYPRYALMGYDHVMYFFLGDKYEALQTPLRFTFPAEGEPYQNSAFMLVHYRTDGLIDKVKY